jgi:subtilisin family serine protease
MRICRSWKWVVMSAIAGLALPVIPGVIATGPVGIRVMERPAVTASAEYAPDRIIVKYRDAAAKHGVERSQLLEAVGATVNRRFATMTDMESLRLDGAMSVEAAVARLASDPRIEFAEPSFIVTTHSVPNDEHFDQQWGLHNVGQAINDYPSQGADIDVDGPEAWDHGVGSSTVVIADIDEGVDVTHPDIAANVWTNPGEVAGNGNDDDGNGFVDDVNGWDFLHDDATVFDGADDTSDNTDFHGTHTSGTIGAVGNNGIGVAGVCWNVRIMSLKFLQFQGTTEDAIAAVDYAVMMKQRGVNIRAINASWGGGSYSSGLYAAIQAAGSADILFCASAGNGGSDGIGDDNDVYPSYPCSFDLPNIISVASWTRYDLLSNFSNFGATSVDIAAPGSLIASTGPNGHYYFSSGTSMAAPHITGSVGLLASISPSLTGAQIKQILLDTSTPVASTQPTVTGGRLNLLAAVESAIAIGGGGGDGDGDGDDDGGPPPPPPPPSPVVTSAEWLNRRTTLYVYGRELKGTAVIEVNGVAVTRMVFEVRDQLPDGSYERIGWLARGKNKRLIPKGVPIVITVYEPTTQLRSAPITFVR